MTKLPETVDLSFKHGDPVRPWWDPLAGTPYRRADWRPIETAPKDGERLFLAGWQEPPREGGRGWWWREIGSWLDGEWWSERADASYLPSQRPTHWQPLPGPPE